MLELAHFRLVGIAVLILGCLQGVPRGLVDIRTVLSKRVWLGEGTDIAAAMRVFAVVPVAVTVLLILLVLMVVVWGVIRSPVSLALLPGPLCDVEVLEVGLYDGVQLELVPIHVPVDLLFLHPLGLLLVLNAGLDSVLGDRD